MASTQGTFLPPDATRPVYTQQMICPTCHREIGMLNPHEGKPEGAKYVVIRRHRRMYGCPERHAVTVLTYCSLCPDAGVIAQTTTGLKGGEWWEQVGHPHDAQHGIDRRRKSEAESMPTAAAVVKPSPPAAAPVPEVAPTERPGVCRSCKAAIVWRLTAQGKWCPLDVVDGVVTGRAHFTTCPDYAQWRQRS